MQDCIGEEGGGMVVWDKKGILYVYWGGRKGQGCTGGRVCRVVLGRLEVEG